MGTRERAAPEALGKAATAAWMTGRRAASGKLATEFQRGLLAMKKAAALKAPCDMWLNRRYCLYSKDQGAAQNMPAVNASHVDQCGCSLAVQLTKLVRKLTAFGSLKTNKGKKWHVERNHLGLGYVLNPCLQV